MNVDVQHAYTRPDEFPTAYEADPRQIEYIDRLAKLMRERDLPVVWTYVAYSDSGDDCGVWGTRSDGADALQNIKMGSRRSQLDDRLTMDPKRDTIINKRMASAFHETHLPSLLNFHRIDTVIVTGGSTSGCVRATAVDSLLARLPHYRAGGNHRRPARKPAFRQPLRSQNEVRGRGAGEYCVRLVAGMATVIRPPSRRQRAARAMLTASPAVPTLAYPTMGSPFVPQGGPP